MGRFGCERKNSHPRQCEGCIDTSFFQEEHYTLDLGFLQNFFQNKNENQVLVLEDKLKSTKVLKGKKVTSYLTRFSQIKSELFDLIEWWLDHLIQYCCQGSIRSLLDCSETMARAPCLVQFPQASRASSSQTSLPLEPKTSGEK